MTRFCFAMNAGLSRAAIVVMALFFTALPGCTTPAADPAPLTLPSYRELADQHNRRIAPIKRLWASTVVEARWEDDKGKRRFEQGEGVLILDLPHKSAMTIGKVGNTKLWVGSNEKHFWMFDELDGRKLYWGTLDGAAADGAGAGGAAGDKPKQASPLPIQPVDVPKLLAILPLPLGDAAAPSVKWQVITQPNGKHGCYVAQAAGQPIRYYFDAATRLPRRVELLDAKGAVALVADLSGQEQVELEDSASGPTIAGRAEVNWPGSATKMNLVLHLSDVTTARRKIKAEAFDLKLLTETVFKPEQVVQVVAP